ncbi:MAG: type III restriction endonuclease subunit R, partial [Muribaculaceae bacterium]|nr:type III restriction endonuclease subunit R [Muribaculaceae bacterium]
EHMFWSKTADKSAEVLERINPAVEIRVSATPKTVRFDEKVRVKRSDVINAEMIKREVVLNPDLASGISDDTVLNRHLMKLALDKRERLAEAYRKLDININPLLLIQLPNDQKESMTAEDNVIAEFVKAYLNERQITVGNSRLAIWLSDEKHNLDGLEDADNMTQVLLFKEAIALGWDCPRAAVLLVFRKLSSNEFTIQTVGRILRMPEQHFYTDDRLNIGYVYTDIAREKISIVTSDADYIRKSGIIAKCRPDITDVELQSVYSDRPNGTRNYFGPDFRKILYDESVRFWNVEQAKGSLFSISELAALCGDGSPAQELPDSDDARIRENRQRVSSILRLDVPNVNIPIPKDIHFQNEIQTIDVTRQSVKFARTAAEIDRVFINEIAQYVTSFESRSNAADKLAGYLLETLADFFGIFDTEAKKVVLYHLNRQKFDRLLRNAVDRYIKVRQIKRQKAAGRALKKFLWNVPQERIYDEDTHHIVLAPTHALQPFAELNSASATEKEFAMMLERNSDQIDWWYKNGDKGCQHFAVEYADASGIKHPFYVDFIIRLKSGKIMLFDTKTPGSEPLAAHLKHNALNDYIAARNAEGANLAGGVIIRDGMNWLWSRSVIDNTIDHEGWDMLDLKRENAQN